MVLAAVGDDWSLWVPEDVWTRMTDQERADLAQRQAALIADLTAGAVVSGSKQRHSQRVP